MWRLSWSGTRWISGQRLRCKFWGIRKRIIKYGYHYRNEVEELAEELSLKVFHTSVKNDKNVEQVFTHLANTFQTREKDLLEVEQVAGGGQPIQIADMSLGLSGAKVKDKKSKKKLKSKTSCAIL
jgi:tRNA nucleotidyltransferase/poly(A) polymerase